MNRIQAVVGDNGKNFHTLLVDLAAQEQVEVLETVHKFLLVLHVLKVAQGVLKVHMGEKLSSLHGYSTHALKESEISESAALDKALTSKKFVHVELSLRKSDVMTQLSVCFSVWLRLVRLFAHMS